ncbi:MAG: M20/M25/M40 family metallo-hydrolase [Burkholderiales bacterium]|nr:M20/M25/M40 family metallo-hydrolase [Burkholderiales bacterium]
MSPKGRPEGEHRSAQREGSPVGAAAAIRAFLAAHRADAERFLAELVRVPSDNPPGDCAPHAARAAALLEAMGFAVERHAVPDAEVRANGMVSCTNLVVRVRFGTGAGPVIALNAHGDVVPPGLGWTADPYGAEVRDGVMYGRGVAVSKSDFATYAFALRALQSAAAAGAPLDGTVELHFTYDEEAGGAIGPAWLLARGVSRPDYVISAGFSYGITTAHNGCLHLEVEVVGRSGHAAEPEKGVDALEAATGILSDLYALRRTYAATKSAIPGIASPTLVVGLIAGGINTNVVPDHVKFRLDRRIIPEEDPEQVEAALIASIEAFARKWPGIGVCVRRVLLAVPFVPVTGQEKLVTALSRHGRDVLGEELPTHGVPIYTDARLYTTAGVPAVLYGAGPRTLVEANGHRADERLVLADLHRATEVVARALVDLLAAR